jgi:F-type H+-transporting ATPase subunit delta
VEASGGNITGSIGASLPGRYALALFETAEEQRAIPQVERDLGQVRDALAESDDLRRLATSPLVARGEAVRAVTATADRLGLSPLTRSFLGVLAENRRLGQLGPVIRAFGQLAARHRGEVAAEVTSAHPLDAPQVDALRQQLRQRVGREVAIDLTIDPSILGGLVVRIGSQMIDSSIRTRLNTLAQAMKG